MTTAVRSSLHSYEIACSFTKYSSNIWNMRYRFETVSSIIKIDCTKFDLVRKNPYDDKMQWTETPISEKWPVFIKLSRAWKVHCRYFCSSPDVEKWINRDELRNYSINLSSEYLDSRWSVCLRLCSLDNACEVSVFYKQPHFFSSPVTRVVWFKSWFK